MNPKQIEFQRANPKALAKFDPSTKACVENCGPARDDPRSEKERKFLCNECLEMPDEATRAIKTAMAALDDAILKCGDAKLSFMNVVEPLLGARECANAVLKIVMGKT